MATKVARFPPLRPVVLSPTITQYTYHGLREKPFYKPTFSLTKEQWQITLLQPWLNKTDPLMPPYPYGKNIHFPEANYGLYGGSKVESGNKISKGRNKGKTLRKWFPNIRLERIRSEALDRELVIPIRARVMRTITKLGGLDEYLTGSKTARIKELGLLGWKLRWLILNTEKGKAMIKSEEAAKKLTETFEDVWEDDEQRTQLLLKQDESWDRLKQKHQRWENRITEQWEKNDKREKPLIKQNKMIDVLMTKKPSDFFVRR